MNKLNLKKSYPYLIAVAILMALSLWFFHPALSGYAIVQNDIIQSKGMSNDIAAFRDSTSIEPLWTNGMFSGMPANQISIREQGNFNREVRTMLTLGLPEHIAQLFLLMVGFLFLGLCMRINVFVATVGAIAFGFSSFYIISIEAGHVNKVWAIAFIAPVVGAFILAYRGYLKWGLILSTLFMMLLLWSNHVQIAYYCILVLVSIGIYYLVQAIRTKAYKNFAFATVGLFIAYSLAALSTAASLLPTREYAAETTRGANQITITPTVEPIEKATDGLDRDYILSWSLGKSETATLFNPYAKGGHSVPISRGELAERLNDSEDFTSQEKQFIGNNIQYYGDQPFTSGPVYIGGLVLLLALIGLFFIESGIKWAFFGVALLSLFLAWGKNMMWLSDFFIDYVPMYAKFRAVTMILIVLEFAFPVLLMLILNQFWENRERILAEKKKFLIVSGSGLALTLILAYSPDLIGMTSIAEREKLTNGAEAMYEEIAREVYSMPAEQLTQYGVQNPNDPNEVRMFIEQITNMQVESFENNFPSLISFRKMIFTSFGLRTFLFVLLGLGLVALYLFMPSINRYVMIGGLGALIAIDLIGINLIYMPNKGEEGSGDELVYEKWTTWDVQKYPHTPNPADLQILEAEMLANPKLASRVKKAEQKASQYASDNEFSMLGRRNYIENERFRAYRAMTRHRVADYDDNIFNSSRTSYFHEAIGGYHGAKLKRYQNLIDFGYLPYDRAVLNMLNVKYLIRGGQVEQNSGAMGNAWLSKSVYVAKNENDEILNLGKRYALENNSSDWTLLVNDKATKNPEVYARERIFLVKGKDSIKIQWPDGLTLGDTAYYVQDVNGKRNWIPKIAMDSDNLNSFTKLITLVVKHNFSPASMTIVSNESKDKVNTKGYSGEGTIRLTSHQLNHLTYEFESNSEQLAVFSEIFYKPGWTAFIDGKEVEHIRVNYVLRGLQVPAGKHKIEFKVNDATYKKGLGIGRIASWLVYLLVLGGIVSEIVRRKKGVE
jgi:hypothetical protein